MLRRILRRIDPTRRLREPRIFFPSLDEEIGEYSSYLKGRVLNAGAGNRDISHLVNGELINQDLPHGIHNANIHVYSPLHEIPAANNDFDTVICNAVLEHVANPAEVVKEIFRILKPGGYFYVSVPFMQPEHLDPTDYQRYTSDGLCKLLREQGFEVVSANGLHNVYVTLNWIVIEWLQSEKGTVYALLKTFLYPLLHYKARTSKTFVH
jgi:SAM-dependent methyltransferase